MQSRQQGFTLVELIVVIVILGILAATALPRFINVATDARVAAMNGVAGAMRSAAALAQSRYVATGDMNAAAVSMGLAGTAQNVAVVQGTGFPQATAAGIESAMQDTTGFNFAHAGGVTTVTQNNGQAACLVTYTQGTGVVNSNAVTTANCGG